MIAITNDTNDFFMCMKLRSASVFCQVYSDMRVNFGKCTAKTFKCGLNKLLRTNQSRVRYLSDSQYIVGRNTMAQTHQ